MMKILLSKLINDESGVTAVEYALMAAAAAAVVGVAGAAFYTKLETAFNAIDLTGSGGGSSN
ncbi:MAG: Flp family type IVb pilin [Sneathiella sp.]|jgi:Flp pilus assembly pilin Flp|uniref:Flp family type IVb pilin n=1 Tax=Sneathiella sp. TaxID=1964365 RepID=UPI000C4CF098|nr:Flp family type IVb pilin [Sneathiella sp.]MAL78309.1 Flp family type IVb pilin [Sneathiella sp.]|tara:strand:- start:647 stop:832 length:186 start_codon:yes stop_codon:yes gene_type:complete